MIRWFLVLGWIGWCAYTGGISGAFYGFILLGITMFVLYTMLDAWNKVKQGVSNARPNVTNQTLYVEHLEATPAKRGQPVSGDPTVPDEDDWAGMIANYRHRQKG